MIAMLLSGILTNDLVYVMTLSSQYPKYCHHPGFVMSSSCRYLPMKNLSVIIYLYTKMLLNALHSLYNAKHTYSDQHNKCHQRNSKTRQRKR